MKRGNRKVGRDVWRMRCAEEGSRVMRRYEGPTRKGLREREPGKERECISRDIQLRVKGTSLPVDSSKERYGKGGAQSTRLGGEKLEQTRGEKMSRTLFLRNNPRYSEWGAAEPAANGQSRRERGGSECEMQGKVPGKERMNETKN